MTDGGTTHGTDGVIPEFDRILTPPMSRVETRRRKRTRVRSMMWTVLSAVLALAAACLIVPPLTARVVFDHEQSAVTATLDASAAGMPKDRLESMLEQARSYNHTLAASGQPTIGEGEDPFTHKLQGDFSGSDDQTYTEALDMGDGVMGSVSIPSIGVDLTIRHGSSDTVLDMGAGHLHGTSLPVGGPSTHTALTGHRGLADKMMFTRLDELHKGSVFYIHTLGRTLAYKVTDIRVVDPGQVDSLRIVKGQDLATLVTCTPYGINTQRLLVTGERARMPQTAPLRAGRAEGRAHPSIDGHGRHAPGRLAVRATPGTNSTACRSFHRHDRGKQTKNKGEPMRTSLSGRLAAGITTIGLLAVGLGATSMPAIAEEKPVDVYIGDSIVANNPAVKVDSTNRWSRLVSDADGATDLNVAVGGTGFLVYQGKTYSDQVDIALSRLKKSGTDVSQVRRVILVGGGNDFQKGIDATVIAKEAKAMQETADKIKASFPAAQYDYIPEVLAQTKLNTKDVTAAKPYLPVIYQLFKGKGFHVAEQWWDWLPDAYANGYAAPDDRHTTPKAHNVAAHRIVEWLNTLGEPQVAGQVAEWADGGGTTKPAAVTIRYDANGGTGSIKDTTGKPGDAITLPETGVTHAGYTLTGWSLSKDGTGQNVKPGGKYTIPENASGTIVVYAVWTKTETGGGEGNIPGADCTTTDWNTTSSNTGIYAGGNLDMAGMYENEGSVVVAGNVTNMPSTVPAGIAAWALGYVPDKNADFMNVGGNVNLKRSGSDMLADDRHIIDGTLKVGGTLDGGTITTPFTYGNFKQAANPAVFQKYDEQHIRDMISIMQYQRTATDPVPTIQSGLGKQAALTVSLGNGSTIDWNDGTTRLTGLNATLKGFKKTGTVTAAKTGDYTQTTFLNYKDTTFTNPTETKANVSKAGILTFKGDGKSQTQTFDLDPAWVDAQEQTLGVTQWDLSFTGIPATASIVVNINGSGKPWALHDSYRTFVDDKDISIPVNDHTDRRIAYRRFASRLMWNVNDIPSFRLNGLVPGADTSSQWKMFPGSILTLGDLTVDTDTNGTLWADGNIAFRNKVEHHNAPWAGASITSCKPAENPPAPKPTPVSTLPNTGTAHGALFAFGGGAVLCLALASFAYSRRRRG